RSALLSFLVCLLPIPPIVLHCYFRKICLSVKSRCRSDSAGLKILPAGPCPFFLQELLPTNSDNLPEATHPVSRPTGQMGLIAMHFFRKMNDHLPTLSAAR